MPKLEVTFQLVTPAFLEGFKAEKQYMRLRETSIKGLIRFWWRALAYAQYGDNISQLNDREAEVFGSTKHAASVMFLPSEHEPLIVEDSPKLFESYMGIKYLGYGLMARNAQQSIPYIKAPWKFTIRLLSQKDFDPLLIDAFKILGLVGGMGRRSRRGFGSLSIVDIKQQGKVLWQSPHTLTDLIRTLQEILPKPGNPHSLPPYTAFGSQTAIYVLGHGPNVYKLWDEVGTQFQMYRSFGRNGRVGSKPAERNFQNDHDLMQQALNHQPIQQAPRRSIFGLPQNYRFSSGGSVSVIPKGPPGDRRASPLIFHLHQLTSDEYIALASVFPAKFLPNEESKITIRANNQTNLVSGSIEQEYSIITNFITGTITNTQKSRFPELRCIWP